MTDPKRPIDPSRNASDFIDPTGMTGITTGSPKQSSSNPDDAIVDAENEPGGIKNFPGPTDVGLPKDATNQKEYNKNLEKGMSEVEREITQDTASETKKPIPQNNLSADATINIDTDPAASAGNQVRDPEDDNDQGINPPSVTGEESVSGDMPSPDSDDDALSNAQAVGTQLSEDYEHPQELDLGRDIDEAEEYDRTH